MPGYGGQAAFGIAKQSSFNVVASGFTGLPILSETITHEIEEIREGDFTRYGWVEPPIQAGKSMISGGFEFEPYPDSFGEILHGFFNVVSGAWTGSCGTYNFYAGGDVTDFDSYLAIQPYTIYAFRGVGSGMLMSDGQFTELTLSMEAGGFLKGSVTVLGRTVTIEDPHTITFETNQPYLWDQASVEWAGSALGTLESFELSMANAVEGIDTMNLTKFWGQSKRTDYFTVNFNGTMGFDDWNDYLRFSNNSYFPVQITLKQGTEICSGFANDLVIDLPQYRYTAFPPNVSGPGRIQVSFTGRGVVDSTSNYSVQISLSNTAATIPNRY